MKARQLIESASFGPETIEALGQAFDAAWREVAGQYGDDPDAIGTARDRLAVALLSVAWEHSRDVPSLKDGALQALRLSDASRRGPARGAADRMTSPAASCRDTDAC